MDRNRKLAAIMFTDIQGYTTLMQESESSAIAIRNRHRDIFQISKLNLVRLMGKGNGEK